MTTLVPAATPVMIPALFTVATAGVAETQALLAAAIPEPVNWLVELTQDDKTPVIVGVAVIVTVAV